MKEVSVDQLKFKITLSMIEQNAIKDLLFKWVGQPTEEIPLAYTESVFAKMEAKHGTALRINVEDQFRYATITEDNQFVIGVLDSNEVLIHRIVSIDEVLVGKHI